MKAAVYKRYGGPEVVEIAEVEPPTAGAGDILVEVRASTVTTADWRFRASAFPGIMWLPGRLMAGLFAPRRRILGGEFAGRVAAIGSRVTRFKPGDEVFGFAGVGAHAEYLTIREDGPVAIKPANLGHDEAAATPFGALSALVFLRDFAKLRSGERVLVIGAAGGVGVHAVQFAKHLGADVAAVCSEANADLVRSLSADRVFDYAREDFTQSGQTWDVIIDPVGKTRFADCKAVLAPGGRHVFLEFGLTEMLQALTTSLRGDRKVVIGISGDTREDLAFVASLLASGAVRPIIDGRYPLDRIADAHARVDGRHKRGSVVVTISTPSAAAAAL